MKKQIRKSVFETNSSSTHSICISMDSELTIPKSLNFTFGEFGWEYKTLQSLSEKSSYLYTGLIANHRQNDVDKIITVLKDKGIEVTVKEPVYINKYFQNGYIDHSNELNDFLNDVCEDVDKLMQYLFSDLSFIITGNDNDNVNICVDYSHYEYFKGN